ncbi:MAG: hypothetical protein COB85_07630 [Bacteroidetes bacterium]|nr:MAG: hypothetical protein COB85_07630 [Bacteroidota bacterium]
MGEMPVVEQAMPLYYAIIFFLKDFPILANIFAVVLVSVQAIVLNNILEKHQVLSEKTKIPALIYTLLICCCPPLLALHPMLFANFFLILLLDRIFLTYRQDEILTKVYDAGLLIGIATMFYLPAIVFLPFYLISISMLRPFNPREWILSCAGFLTPLAFVMTSFYWTGELTDFFISIQISSLSTFTFDFSLIFPYLPLLLVLGFLSLISIKRYIEEMNNRVVKVAKMYAVFTWFFIFAVLSILMAPSMSVVFVSGVIIALTVFLSNFFVTFQRKIFSEFILLLLIATIIYSHIVPL